MNGVGGTASERTKSMLGSESSDVVGATQRLENSGVARTREQRQGLLVRTRSTTHLETDPLVFVIVPETSCPGADDRGQNASTGRQVTERLADVVEQRGRHLFPTGIGSRNEETTSDENRMTSVSHRHVPEKFFFAGRQLGLDPSRVDRRRWRRGQRTPPTPHQVHGTTSGRSHRISAPPPDRGPRMGGPILVEQPFLGHPCVHLRGRDGCVPEHLLDDAQIGSVVEHVCRARVSQHVG